MIFFVLSFVPYQGVVRKIVKSFAGKYPRPWTTWQTIPQSQRDIWFNEFKVGFLYMNLNVVIKLFDLFINILELCYTNTITGIQTMKSTYGVTLSTKVQLDLRKFLDMLGSTTKSQSSYHLVFRIRCSSIRVRTTSLRS